MAHMRNSDEADRLASQDGGAGAKHMADNPNLARLPKPERAARPEVSLQDLHNLLLGVVEILQAVEVNSPDLFPDGAKRWLDRQLSAKELGKLGMPERAAKFGRRKGAVGK